MGCGCKGKNNPTPQQPQPTIQQTTTTQSSRPLVSSVQESVKKVVEKYYKK